MAICDYCWKEFIKRNTYNVCSRLCYRKMKTEKDSKKILLKVRRKTENSSLPKNAVRWVPNKVKEEVFERDNYSCVICGSRTELEKVPHHAFYGWEAWHDKRRNDANQLVTICVHCHHELHFGSWNDYRIKAKQYLYDKYGEETYEEQKPYFLKP